MNIRSSVAVDCFLPGRAKDLSAPLYIRYETNLSSVLAFPSSDSWISIKFLWCVETDNNNLYSVDVHRKMSFINRFAIFHVLLTGNFGMVILRIPTTFLLLQYCGLSLRVGETAPFNGPIVHPSEERWLNMEKGQMIRAEE